MSSVYPILLLRVLLWFVEVCVYVYCSFGSKVIPGTVGCIAIGSAVLCILMSRLLIYSAGSGVNKSASCFVWI